MVIKVITKLFARYILLFVRFIVLDLEGHVPDTENTQDQEQEVVLDDPERGVDHGLVTGVSVDLAQTLYFDPERVLDLVLV